MKNVLLFLLLALLITTTAKAQGDYFAPIGAEWCFGSILTFNYPHYSKYYSEKDTVIIGQNCRKISAYSIYPEGGKREWPPLFVYATPDTVYCYNDSFNLFVPMYIFNVSEGDTLTYHVSMKLTSIGIPGSSWSDSLFQVVVTKVDSVYVDGIYLRQVWTQPVENWGFIDSYIERIGSTNIFFGNIFLGSFPETYHTALRSYQDSAISYKYTEYGEYDCEFFPTAINEKTKQEEILIYPNPSNRIFSVNIGLYNVAESDITLTDISGRRIFPTISFGHRIINIDMKNFLAGIYLLTMNYNKQQYHYKFIKN